MYSPFCLLNLSGADKMPPLAAGCEVPQVAQDHDQAFNLQSRIATVTKRIYSPDLRAQVETVFGDLVFLLDYLGLIEAILNEGNQVRKVVVIFELVRTQALSLIEFLEKQAERSEGASEPLGDAFDSMAYAMKHDLRRIYDSELKSTLASSPSGPSYATLMHAKWVLTNCLQQSIANLAQVFDERLTGASLFLDLEARREQSLLLCDELSELVALTQFAQENCNSDNVVEQLRTFQKGNMRYLISKDWQECERLIEEVATCISRGDQAAPLLHRLGCYFETLLGQVQTRAVIADSTMESTYTRHGAVLSGVGPSVVNVMH